MFLENSKSFDLQCLVSVADQDLDCPFWALDWNALIVGDKLLILAKTLPFDAARKTNAVYLNTLNEKELCVLGERFDIIYKVSFFVVH
jgi:hypothetical protein